MSWFLKQMMVRGGYMDAAAGDGGDGGKGGGGGPAGSGGAPEGGEGGGAGDGGGKNKGGQGGEGGQGDPAGSRSGKPSDAEAALLREVMDKKAKLKETSEELARVNARLAEFDGLDAKELRELVKQRKDAETAQLEAKGAWDALKSQMVEQHGAELRARDEKLSAAEQRTRDLEAQIAELSVGNAFGNSKFINEELTLSPAKARRVYGAHFEFQDGAVVAFDKPAGAKDRAVLVDSKGEPLSFEAAIAKLVDIDPDKDSLRKSKLRTGVGSSTGGKQTPHAEPEASKVTTGRSKIAAGLAARTK
ncbi:DUF6651 domain-containing protein [Burkholderia cepacia]|uniref:DUF6651 domain-containing protein n=1 Tax=Burkholderia cepacia TaxID=292 RepID=UPI00075BB1FD|nr:DUF6651 domain-containing protein [Burkholderia cepacia]KVQ35797.1 hypothetical protein WK03_35610 [Burkholderia cepacia]NTX17947.1 hypothetical protein [Burkholderia cepacia]